MLLPQVQQLSIGHNQHYNVNVGWVAGIGRLHLCIYSMTLRFWRTVAIFIAWKNSPFYRNGAWSKKIGRSANEIKDLLELSTMPGDTCIVCGNMTAHDRRASFHRFLKYSCRWAVWLWALGVVKDQLRDHLHVCCRHSLTATLAPV